MKIVPKPPTTTSTAPWPGLRRRQKGKQKRTPPPLFSPSSYAIKAKEEAGGRGKVGRRISISDLFLVRRLLSLPRKKGG